MIKFSYKQIKLSKYIAIAYKRDILLIENILNNTDNY